MYPPAKADEDAIRALYRELLRCWNANDATTFASLFESDGVIIVFDGTLVSGKDAIATHFGSIFAQYEPPTYIQKTLGVYALSPDFVLLHGIVGMYSLTPETINPTLNTVQTLIAHKFNGDWRITHFQNTRASYVGRPDLVKRMTEELQREAEK